MAGIDLSACDFQHIDRSNPDMMEASLKSIIRAEAIAEAGTPVDVHENCTHRHCIYSSAQHRMHTRLHVQMHAHMHMTCTVMCKCTRT